MIRTILTPIDGSVHAQMALDLSTDLAAKYDAQLVLLHIVTRDEDVPRKLYDEAEREFMEAEGDAGAAPLLLRSKVLEYFGQNLLRSSLEFAKGKGVKQVETIIDDGAADKRILHHAMTRSADIIVMGSRGFGKLKALVLGSVSHNVFHLAPCSCVTVHHTGTQSTFEGIKSIQVPTDGSAQADKAVDLASDIAAKYRAKLSLVYVTWRGPSLENFRDSIDMNLLSESARDELDPSKHPITEHVSSTFIPPVVSSDTLKEIGEQVLARGRKTAEAKGVSSTNTVLIDGDPARKILQVAKREQADLITMGSRGLGGAEGMLAGSVSYKVNHSAPCNCLVVR
ncbi:MAG: universal stress protein [Gammaproteobacteria bacterium]|nr:universal stress protein [Gammaproteobacteria bacterium]